MIEQTVSIERMEDAIDIFGSFDENIRIIEQELAVRVVSRDDQLKISGEEDEAVDQAAKVIQGLLSLSARGETIVAGNWKMHKTATETKLFAERLKGALPRVKRCSIVLCVPYVDIPAAVKILKDSRVAVGAQNLHWETSGPYTGEVSAAMLADLDVKYVIIGHSERRALFGETDLTINKKLHAALDAGLRPILCVGEDLEQRELGVTLEFISYQLKAALAGVTPEEMRRVVIAYEPIWAIGTGNTATPEQAGEVCAAIRGVLRKLYGARIARSTTIQYGGSMNAANAQDLLNQEDVDGGLIGTAALDVEQFLQIIQTANQDGPQP